VDDRSFIKDDRSMDARDSPPVTEGRSPSIVLERSPRIAWRLDDVRIRRNIGDPT